MERLLADEREDSKLKPFMNELVYKRNASMAEQLGTHLSTSSKYFAVIGAGHLVGDRGILQLLQQRGYKVDQLIRR